MAAPRLLLLFFSAALYARADDLPNEYESGYHFAPEPPAAPPRAKLPALRRQPPAHEPMAYAALHGVSLETDEEGNLRVGGQAQEGYESLYFDPAQTTTTNAPAPYESNSLVKKRVSRSSEGSREVREPEGRKLHNHDTTQVVMQPLHEIEGSGIEVTVDNVDEKSHPLIGLQTEGISFVWNTEPALRADLRKQETVNFDSAKIANNDARLKIGNPVANRIYKVGNKKLSEKELPKDDSRKFPSRFANTATVVTAGQKRAEIPSIRVGGTANINRGTSRRSLRRGRGTWHSRKARLSQRVRKNLVVQKVVLDRVALNFLRRGGKHDKL